MTGLILFLVLALLYAITPFPGGEGMVKRGG